jgi:SAM-dependent methyltransferase
MSNQERSPAERPNIIERRAYRPNLPVEEFMVPALERAIRTIIDDLDEGPQLRILDAGCGGQPFRFVFETKRNTYVSCDATDPLGVVDHVAELDRDLPQSLLDEIPFDFILCSEVLEHVLDWERAFKNLAQLLAPNGRLLITTPFVYVLHEQPYDFWRATPHAIRALADRHGLAVVKLERMGGTWEVIGTVLGAAAPSARARDESLGARVATRVAKTLSSWVLASLRKQRIQKLVEFDNAELPIYLANVALLEKRADR